MASQQNLDETTENQKRLFNFYRTAYINKLNNYAENFITRYVGFSKSWWPWETKSYNSWLKDPSFKPTDIQEHLKLYDKRSSLGKVFADLIYNQENARELLYLHHYRSQLIASKSQLSANCCENYSPTQLTLLSPFRQLIRDINLNCV